MTDDGPRILVVDDNEDNRFVLVQRLRREGFERISVARDGQECLQKLRDPDAGPFALVLLDIMMPKLNGYEVLEEINRSEALKSVPVIMITAVGDMDSVYRCIGLGAKDYIVKPFNLDLVRTRIRTWVAPQAATPARGAEAGPPDPGSRAKGIGATAKSEEGRLGVARRERPAAAVQRPEVGVLVGEICGLEAFADQAEPDDVAAALARWRELCLQVCEDWHVAAVGVDWCRMTATAGLFRTVGNPVAPLVGAAEDLASRLRSGPPAWSLRAGLHFGPVAGCLIDPDRLHIECWGKTWREAAALLEGAEPATLLVSEAATAHLGDRPGDRPGGRGGAAGAAANAGAEPPLTVVTIAPTAATAGDGAGR